MNNENKVIASNQDSEAPITSAPTDGEVAGVVDAASASAVTAVFPGYIYKHHQGKDIFISPVELPEKELYCEHCNASDELQGKYDDQATMSEALSDLLAEYTCRPSEGYDAFVQSLTEETQEEASKAENMSGAVQIFGQGMVSIFVVLGVIAVVVAVLKKLDNRKK